MISRTAKAAFYSMFSPLMTLNGLIYRNFRAPSKDKMNMVHLGPGQKNYLENWINVDANMFTGKCDVWADLRNRLPFKNESIDIFYSHHVIEHLPDIPFHISELYRCLKMGGKIRIGGPNGDNAILKFVENDLSWFSDFPVKKESIGGRFENFIFCKGEHLTILIFSFLEELLLNAGFKNIKLCKPVIETNYPEFVDKNVLAKEFESDFNCPHTIIIEAEK
jgi:SAM-dependent methyltransferase